jgi:hypothetical protein
MDKKKKEKERGEGRDNVYKKRNTKQKEKQGTRYSYWSHLKSDKESFVNQNLHL